MYCWWCCHDFDTQRLEMPYAYDAKKKTFQTTGNFCSWSCMKSFALEKYGVHKGGTICSNMLLMRKRMYDEFSPIERAPSRYLLNVFGGTMTIEEFRQGLVSDATKSVVKDVPKEEIKEKGVKTVSVSSIATNEKKLEEIKETNVQNESLTPKLKLKRSKPLPRSHTDLGSALGLIINPA